MAAVEFGAALLEPDFGMLALVPFGRLLAFSTDVGEPASNRWVVLSTRNVVLGAVMGVAFGRSRLGRRELAAWTLVTIAGSAAPHRGHQV